MTGTYRKNEMMDGLIVHIMTGNLLDGMTNEGEARVS